MILSLVGGLLAWSLTQATSESCRHYILFLLGICFASLLPVLALLSPHGQGPTPSQERRQAHQALIALQKQVLLHPDSETLLHELSQELQETGRYLEMARLYATIEKIRPLSHGEIIAAATCLLDASPGTVPPKALKWLSSIPPSSSFYPQVLRLKEQISSP